MDHLPVLLRKAAETRSLATDIFGDRLKISEIYGKYLAAVGLPVLRTKQGWRTCDIDGDAIAISRNPFLGVAPLSRM